VRPSPVVWWRLPESGSRGVTAAGWHSITVKPKNSRYTVRARSGYEGK